MSDVTTQDDDSLSPADLERVIAVCERFEAAWKGGRRVRTEDFLGEATELARTRLFRELLALEIELRRADGGRPGPDEYRLRFPGRDESVAAAFAAADEGQPRSTAPGDETTAKSSESWRRAGETRMPGPETLLYTPGSSGTGTSWGEVVGYELLEEIGRGGMGVVYKARHLGLNRMVALKLIREGGHARDDLLVRLRTEAEALARLRHENIVQVYDVGEARGVAFVALELLEGGTLAARLAGTPQPDRQAAATAATLARAVHAAHRAGIVHRDLKPLNVLYDDAGRLKVADFGLAKRLEDESGQTQSGQVMGTPSYMAPEQARGDTKAVGPAADVYALGAILYEMLTGRPPFKGPTGHETVRQVIADEPVPPSRLQPRVSRDVETVCLKCLAKEPGRRYATAADMADDLDRYLKGQPILARRTPALERGVKWARRHPTSTTLTALALIAALALAAAGSWYQGVLRQRVKDDGERLARRLTDGTYALLKGQDELAQGHPVEAELTLSNLLTATADEPRLGALRLRASAQLARARAAIDRAEAEAARLEADARDRARLGRFRAGRDDALYHATQFAGLDPTASRASTFAAAESALAVFSLPAPLPGSLSPAERDEITEGSYVLLLILARAEGRPADGLRRLDAAARLRPPTRAYLQQRADCLARLGDVEAAEAARCEAGCLALATAFDHFLTGLEAFGRREWPAAAGHFDAVLLLQPDHFWAHALSAVCFLQPELMRADLAGVHLGACLQREPGFAWLHVLRGFASYQAAVVSRDPSSPRFGAAELDYREAERLLDEPEAPNPDLRYVLLVNRGLLRLERREWDRAIADLEAATELNNLHYLAFANLAQVYQRRGEPDEAVAQFGRALALSPDLPALYRGRADVELTRAHPTPEHRALALRDLDDAIRLEPPGTPVLARDHTNRALLFFHDHDDEPAVSACDAALAAVPDHLDAHLLRTRALLRLGRYADVVRSCDALLSRPRAPAEAHEYRRLAREQLDDFAGAIEDVTQALSLRPGQPSLLVRRGELYLIENSPLLALRDFEEAARLAPTLADARAGLGTARVRLGRFREAVSDAEAAAGLGPRDHRVLYKSGRVYALAAAAATSEVRTRGRDGVLLVSKYQDRALALVRAARDLVPAADRDSFESAIQTDPALVVVRRRLRLARPAEAGRHMAG